MAVSKTFVINYTRYFNKCMGSNSSLLNYIAEGRKHKARFLINLVRERYVPPTSAFHFSWGACQFLKTYTTSTLFQHCISLYFLFSKDKILLAITSSSLQWKVAFLGVIEDHMATFSNMIHFSPIFSPYLENWNISRKYQDEKDLFIHQQIFSYSIPELC